MFLVPIYIVFDCFSIYPSRNIEIEVEDDNEDEEIEDVRKSERTQQPPVRINKNLMKIKMEEDYNPLLVPNVEPMEENETDMVEGHNGIVDHQEEAVDENETEVGEVGSQPNVSQVK